MWMNFNLGPRNALEKEGRADPIGSTHMLKIRYSQILILM